MRLWNILIETNVRLGEKATDLARLSVSQHRGVVPSNSLGINTMQAMSLEKYKVVERGDLVLNRFNAYKGALGRAPMKGIVSPDYFTGRIDSEHADNRYVEYFLRATPIANIIERDMSGMGSGDPNSSAFSRFDVRSLFNLAIPVKNAALQQRIADYLDRETAEIDAAVADLDKYVELLEKRKLSKIESALNAISYQMCPVGLLADVTLGKMVSTTPPKAGGLERQYLRAAHVQPGGRLDFTVAEKKMWFSEKELERLDLLTGDVVVVEGGAGFGRSAYLESDLEGWGFQNSINRVRVDSSKADGRFVHLMLSRALLNGSIGISVDTATLPHFTAEKLARFRIPTCEIHKQKQLSHEVHKDILTANNLIAESMKLRNLLLKRRSVLITEVVTGRKQV